MKRLVHILAILAFAFALLMGAAGGAMAHVDMHATPADHHGSHGAPHGTSQKAALAAVAPCCPAAETPDRHAIAAPVMVTEAPWQPHRDDTPGARDITPEPPPPKTAL